MGKVGEGNMPRNIRMREEVVGWVMRKSAVDTQISVIDCSLQTALTSN